MKPIFPRDNLDIYLNYILRECAVNHQPWNYFAMALTHAGTAATYLEVSIILGTREPRVLLCKLLSPETNL